MSLHGYSETYGNGGSLGYPQPGSPYQFHTFHPSLHDSNAFRQFYASQLATLTVNSRPIIQHLSMIAQENTRLSNIVVQCVEAHIRRVGPNIKLPAWYLLDAISKNVPVPYASLFAPIVADLFFDSYYQVDPMTRSKMEEMLLTWRDGGQHGREVFGVAARVAIEHVIWPSSSSSAPRTITPPKLSPPQVTKGQVLADLEVTLAQQERKLRSNPYDSGSASQNIEVLQQLRTVVQTTYVKQHELVAIDKQLRQMSQDLAAVDSAHRPSYPPPSVPLPLPQVAYTPPQSNYSIPSLPQYSPPPTVNYAVQDHYSYPQASTSQVPASTLPISQPLQSTFPNVNVPPRPVETSSANITDLFNSLVKAGIVPAAAIPSTNTSAVGTSHSEASKSDTVEREADLAYEQKILSMSIHLNTGDIAKQRSGVVLFLYEHMPLQCKQCAIRFPEGPAGKKHMEDHLDMHFRQNQKASQSIGRGHNRSWFVGANDWIVDVGVDAQGKRRTDGSSAKKAAAAAAAEQEAKLRNSFVIVPPGDEAKLIQCPICKETLKSEFLEDDEDWAWKNAVRVQGRIYHATCHAETFTANSLASRLRHEAAAERSRSGTPDVAGIRTTPPKTTALSVLKDVKRSQSPETRLSGTKRKADELDNVKIEGDDTPPSKKVAVSIK
ncbi:hypothetical protein BU17DRAFT_80117 [Hysterangium stoloniferum]|nr:hypothetical protein BU17DRAFT_80117 [Hysterangium stoloniferum]